MSSVVHGIGGLLAAAGLGAYTTGVLPKNQTPITVATMPSGGDKAITVTTYPGGPPPDSRNGWEYPRLQVKVRSKNPLTAMELDRDVFDVLQTASGPLPDTDWVLSDCYALQSEAQPLGADDNARHEYVRNYQLSTHRTG